MKLEIKDKEKKYRGVIDEIGTEAVCDSKNGKFTIDLGERKIFENQADIWLTTKEAADFLRISPKCLLNLTSNGKIPYFKFGRRNRFLLSNLNKILLAQPRGTSYGN